MPTSKALEVGPARPVGADCVTISVVASVEIRDRIVAALPCTAELEQYDDIDAALSGVIEDRPGVAIVAVPETSSATLGEVAKFGAGFPTIALLLLCDRVDRWGVRASIAAGVAGIVLSDDLDHALAPCLSAVSVGQVCVPRIHARQIEPPALSSREKQILGLVVMGFMNGQIAQQLCVAESTVKSHLSSAFSKLGVRSRNEAVRLILDPDGGLGPGILAIGGAPVADMRGVATQGR